MTYFSQGPYLELLRDTGVPRLLGALASRSRSPRMQALARLSSWNRRSGLCALCLEGTQDEQSGHGDLLRVDASGIWRPSVCRIHPIFCDPPGRAGI